MKVLSVAEKTHLAFSAQSRAMVDQFHEAALKAGGTDHGKPGIRTIYHPNYYGAFILDPDGHNIEAVCHLPETKQNKVKGVSPVDVLESGKDTGEFHGLTVRKGTIKAAIENVKILESAQASWSEKQAAKDMVRKLAPDMIALELNKYVTWKNHDIQAIFAEIDLELKN